MAFGVIYSEKRGDLKIEIAASITSGDFVISILDLLTGHGKNTYIITAEMQMIGTSLSSQMERAVQEFVEEKQRREHAQWNTWSSWSSWWTQHGQNALSSYGTPVIGNTTPLDNETKRENFDKI